MYTGQLLSREIVAESVSFSVISPCKGVYIGPLESRIDVPLHPYVYIRP